MGILEMIAAFEHLYYPLSDQMKELLQKASSEVVSQKLADMASCFVGFASGKHIRNLREAQHTKNQDL